jgi:Fe-S oxidoreductase
MGVGILFTLIFTRVLLRPIEKLAEATERVAKGDWAQALGVKTLAENPEVDWLYFTGCFKGFDDRNKKVAIALVKILQRIGVSIGVLGPEEGCCGDPARRMGNEYLYSMLVEKNLETFERYKVKKILTTCPHCYNTLKNEYSQFGGNFEVIHQTEFLKILNGYPFDNRFFFPFFWFHHRCFLQIPTL